MSGQPAVGATGPGARRLRVLSGMRPTGPLHLGNYFGALKQWVELQDRYECYFCIVDWHAMMSEYADPSAIRANVREVLLDWLAAGLDPERSVLFVQSAVPEHAELHLLFSAITPLGWLERNPTYKEQLRELTTRDIHTYGYLGYPVLQAADICMYKADLVPVGIDQAAHLELTREIVRRFNSLYGPVFPEPQTLLSETPKVPGVDGRKMSKSYGNAIYLCDEPAAIEEKILNMLTDPARKRRSDPGNPDVCPVFDYRKLFSSPETVAYVNRACRAAEIGCVEDKRGLAADVVEQLRPISERRRRLAADPARLEAILAEGNRRARAVAQRTMEEVRRAVKLA
ncbi:MAG TPA: tryptophan--tRNA ligase [Thermodesulfobacteriota bacterium]|nr:tryptophan--tRNA ligase [Thermodesulfobacteriota bacterium]